MHLFLETERLLLRRFTDADVDNLVELDGDPEVMRYLTGGKATPREAIETQVLPRILGYYQRFAGYGFWDAVEGSTGQFLGWFHLRPPEPAETARPGRAQAPEATLDRAPDEAELGYRLRRTAWGKGYATEGSRALIHKAFTELGAQRVTATTMAVNTASRRVMEKAGLTLVRTYHETWADPIEGADQGEVEYALAKIDWERSRLGTR